MRLLRHSGLLTGFALFLAACSGGATTDHTVSESEDIVLASAPNEEAGPVAIELFTSQGCSSCPPADRLVSELVADPGLVIITRPVTYWDRLGWRDTLARPENTALQRAYANRLSRGGGRSYTPQAVVNGRVGLVGSRRGELEQAVAEARAERPKTSITIEENETGYRILIDGTAESDAMVRLLALDRSETVDIGRGENGGRSVTYTNILRAERDIGHWTGGELAIEIGAEDLYAEGSDRYAIVVRNGSSGSILAAQYLDG